MNELVCFLLGFTTFACCCAPIEDEQNSSPDASDLGAQRVLQISRDLDSKKCENQELRRDCETLKQQCETLKQRHHYLEQENAILRQAARSSPRNESDDDAFVRPPAYEDVFKKEN